MINRKQDDSRSLLRKRRAPPPTATMTMLESMLDETKTKKPKKYKPNVLRRTNDDENVSNQQSIISFGVILPSGGLEDAPTFVHKKDRSKMRMERPTKKKSVKKVRPEVSLAERKQQDLKRTGADAKPTNMGLTLNIGRGKKRLLTASSSVSSSVVAKASEHVSRASINPFAPVSTTLLPKYPGEPSKINQPPISCMGQAANEFDFEETIKPAERDPSRQNPLTPSTSTSRDLSSGLTEPKSANPFKYDSISSQAPSKRKVNNDNFVRLNLRNSAGACRGARNKKLRKSNHNASATRKRPKKQTAQTGVDPLDDFIDGVYHPANESNNASSNKKLPQCSRHGRPCKLLTVKKNAGNKGRKFYVCSLPRGEECNHFEWEDNTVEAAQRALLRNSSFSGFVARQVAAYSQRFQALTVPELRNELRARQLASTGKRSQLLMRLSLWVRDEVSKVGSAQDSLEPEPALKDASVVEDQEDDGSRSDNDSVSSEELELCHELQPDDIKSGSKCAPADGLNSLEDNQDDDDDEFTLPAPSIVPKCAGEKQEATSSLQSSLQELFGYESFRDGQEWAINRCLEKQRTLLVAPTGFGKSLCYAFPAALMDGICIVVSPLISLMQDQLRQLPPRIPAATLSGNLSAAAMASTVDDVIRGRVKILFVSPERLASPSFRRLFQMRWNPTTNTKERSFPTVSLLCVDEAHCVSQWGHNFRPSYLRLRSLLEMVQPEGVLAMTATALPLVVKDVCDSLGIPSNEDTNKDESDLSSMNNGSKVLSCSRDNINVCCKVMANQGERLAFLCNMLRKTQVGKSTDGPTPCLEDGCLARGSVIVYVWRQMDAEVVAENLMTSGIEGGVVVYHGGMDYDARAKAQGKFMRGKARICVATVAFGMGIDKANVIGVVHMYLPGSPENYLQEIGRAGRDGRPAMAVALVLSDEIVVRHSLAHSNMLSRSQIRALLELLRKQVLETLSSICDSKGLEIDLACWTASINVALPLQSSILATDCKIETIETLISLLEEFNLDDPLLRVQGSLLDQATITLKRRSLEKLSKIEKIALCIQKCGTCRDSPDGGGSQNGGQGAQEQRTKETEFLSYSFGSHSFSITRCANLLGESAEPRHAFAALRRLQTSGELELVLDASLTGKAFHTKMEPSGIQYFAGPDSCLDELADRLVSRFSANVTAAAKKAMDSKYILHQLASVDQTEPSARLSLFQGLVEKYFNGHDVKDMDSSEDNDDDLPRGVLASMKKELCVDVSSLLRDMSSFPHFESASAGPITMDLRSPETRDYAALALTKFMHAIDTPRAPSSSFSRHPYHGKWRDVKFTSLLNAIEDMLNPSLDH